MQNAASTPLPLDGYAVAPELRTLAIDAIVVDRGIHPRSDIRGPEVAAFVDLLREGLPFPPLAVFFDGEIYYLSDGFHRFDAYLAEGRQEARAEIHWGTRREATIHAITANARHGLRLTNEEKRAAVHTLFADSEWSTRSDREIARACACSHPTVAAIRKRLTITGNSTSDDVRLCLNKHGDRVPMRMAGLRRNGDPSPDAVKTNTADPQRPEESRDTHIGTSDRFSGRGSLQLRNLLAALRDGQSIADAATIAGIPVSEAELHAAAETNGEYADVIQIAEDDEQPMAPCLWSEGADLEVRSDQVCGPIDREPEMPGFEAALIVDALDALIIKLGDPRHVADEILAADDDNIHRRFGDFLDWFLTAGQQYETAQGTFDAQMGETSDER